jgi:chloramphenicol-sensitive protein RarD
MRVGQSEEARNEVGLLCGLGAHAMWGLMPLYIWSLANVWSLEILAHRIVWCAIFLLVLVTIFRRWGDLGRCFRNGRTFGLLAMSSLLIACNWLCYIYAANNGQTVQASFGYFVNPLFSIFLGMLFFRERLRSIQWLAVLLAAGGVVVLIVAGEVPWIALALTVTFGFYGLVRKLTPVDAVLGLSVESLLLVPAALGCLLYWTATGTGSFGNKGVAIDLLLLGTGIVTALPLLCFGQAARRLPLTTLGLLQNIAPTWQFLLAVLVRGEEFNASRAISFGFIWTALLVFSVESLLRARRRVAAVGPEATPRIAVRGEALIPSAKR